MTAEKPLAESATIDQLVESFVQRLRAGEAVSIEEYQQQYPHLADEIGAILPPLQMLETCRPEDEPPLSKLSAAEDVPPNQLGDYRIIQEIGRGGMGIVYEAEHDAMRRRVALKVLPKSMAQRPSHLARFELEARSAGQMHHTNIVPVFEVGEDRGFHFYAMQFIRGQNLDLVIEEMRNMRQHGSGSQMQREPTSAGDASVATEAGHSANLSQTLAFRMADEPTVESVAPTPSEPASGSSDSIFGSSEWAAGSRGRSAYMQRVAAVGMQVADALAYAHHNGILHRDIKPANLLLDTDGTVWVTDFGLAKGDEDGLTQTGDIVGTLKYMPPERFDGQTDARSDIYCLGLTLYELSTLQSAFAATDRAQLLEQVTNSTPAAPRTVDARIPRDFETIILKAIDRNPERRYQTARDLAEDLHAFLMDQPIRARRISVSERFWRICRRNPITAALTAAFLTLLLTAAIGASMFAYQIKQKSTALQEQNDRASNHLALTEQTIDGMLKRLSHELKDLPQTSVVREQLLGEALELQKKMLELEQGNPSIALRTVNVHKRMAELQQLLGDPQAALASAREAIDLASSLDLEGSDELHFELGRSHAQMASLLRTQGEFRKAREEAQLAIEEFLQVAQPKDDQLALASAYRELGAIEEQLGSIAAAESALQQALQLLEQPGTAPHSDAGRQKTTAEALNSLAILYRASGRAEEAEELYLKCITICQRMANEGHQRIEALDQLGISAINLGNLMMSQSRHEEAAVPYARAAETFAELERDFPRVVRYQERAARSLMSLGLVQSESGNLAEAEKNYRRAIEKLESLDRLHGLPSVSFDVLAASYNNLGNVLVDGEEFDAGLSAFEESIRLRKRIADRPTSRPVDQHALNRARGNHANVYQKLRKWDQAHELLVAIYEDQKLLVVDHPTQRSFGRYALWLFDRLADGMRATKRFEDVITATEDVTQLLPEVPTVWARAGHQLALAAGALDDPTQQDLKNRIAQLAIEGLDTALRLGWQPREPLAEEEAFQVLWEYDAFHALID